MIHEEYSDKELKLTAALYASRERVLEHVRATGRLPKRIELGGAWIGVRLLIERRGTDIRLTPDERLVYKAILKEGRLPGGGVRLVEQARRGKKKKTSTKGETLSNSNV